MDAYIIAVISMVLLSGCYTPHLHKQMQPDGKTWDVTYGRLDADVKGCAWSTSVENCVIALKPGLEKHGVELCNGQPKRIFSCTKRERGAIGCLVECPEDLVNSKSGERKKDISDSNEASAAPKQEKVSKSVIEKAKKCQAKGGVWVNDSCQIDIE